jgi:hypothetical protein
MPIKTVKIGQSLTVHIAEDGNHSLCNGYRMLYRRTPRYHSFRDGELTSVTCRVCLRVYAARAVPVA